MFGAHAFISPTYEATVQNKNSLCLIEHICLNNVSRIGGTISTFF